jgi:hypothetical protein
VKSVWTMRAGGRSPNPKHERNCPGGTPDFSRWCKPPGPWQQERKPGRGRRKDATPFQRPSGLVVFFIHSGGWHHR